VLKIYNTMSRSVEDFVAMEPGHVRLYTCGPTVHDYAHVGNFRTFTSQDCLRRTFKRQGFRVTQVMNITDVEDKIIRKARALGKPIAEVTATYTRAFHEDRRALRIEDAEFYPLATEHMDDIAALIARLEAKGLAYRSDGSIYYRVASFPEYGRLAHLDLASLRPGERVEADEYEKEGVQDFALWKGPKEGEPSWDTVIGPGRPGWHIECSAMSMRYLGPSFDLHGGGKDLIFPHHVNEIAQSEGATGQTFCRYWMHCEFLTEGETKMSKSLGNIRTVHALIEAGWEPRAIRYALMTAHYRKPLSFTEETLEQATAALKRLDNLTGRLATEPRGHHSGPLTEEAAKAVASFDAALGDDLNLPEALAALHNLITTANQRLDRGEVMAADGRATVAALASMDQVLAIAKAGEDEAPAEIKELAARREAARKGRDYAAADGFRDEILRLGWVVEDIKDGTRVRRK